MSSHYDVIIIDSPPVLPVADALIIAPLCTGTVLAASPNQSDRRQVRAAVEILQRVGPQPVHYAAEVLEIVRSYVPARSAAVMSMAAGSKLEARLRAILETGAVPGGSLRFQWLRWPLAVGFTVAALALGIAAWTALLTFVGAFGFWFQFAPVQAILFLVGVAGSVLMGWAGWQAFQAEGGKFQVGTSGGTAAAPPESRGETTSDEPAAPPPAEERPPAPEAGEASEPERREPPA
jgi:hypothetical protein